MVIVEDITNGYNICVAYSYEKGLELAKEYVENLFWEYDNATYQLKSHYPKDIRKKDLVGISISDIDNNMVGFGTTRTTYFFGHIKRNGKVFNKYEKI